MGSRRRTRHGRKMPSPRVDQFSKMLQVNIPQGKTKLECQRRLYSYQPCHYLGCVTSVATLQSHLRECRRGQALKLFLPALPRASRVVSTSGLRVSYFNPGSTIIRPSMLRRETDVLGVEQGVEDNACNPNEVGGCVGVGWAEGPGVQGHHLRAHPGAGRGCLQHSTAEVKEKQLNLGPFD